MVPVARGETTMLSIREIGFRLICVAAAVALWRGSHAATDALAILAAGAAVIGTRRSRSGLVSLGRSAAAMMGRPLAVTPFDVGYAHLRAGHVPEAVNALRRAVDSDPTDADAHFHLGGALAEIGDDEGAAACFRRSVEIRPLDPRAHYRLGLALARSGRRIQGIDALREAIRLRPQLLEARRALESLGADASTTEVPALRQRRSGSMSIIGPRAA